MKVLYLSNDGAGFAGELEVAEGTTVNQFFRERMGADASESSFDIRVNRQIAPPDQVLKEGDRVTLFATKIDGAVNDA